MEVNGRIYKFLNYIGEPVQSDFIYNFYVTNDIKHDRTELFKDFITSLMTLVLSTYMGDDITSRKQQKQHFDWCWNKNLANFRKEGIDLENKGLYEYFLNFTDDIFYTVNNKENEELSKHIMLLWEILFDYNSEKTEPDLEMLLRVYKLFTKSLEK